MLDGKKSISFKIFYAAIDRATEKTGEDGLEIFKKGLTNVTPQVEVKSRRVGGATFQIPQEIRNSRKTFTGYEVDDKFARKRNGRSMAEKLAAEIMAAAVKKVQLSKRKKILHRMADANKAFSHFRV